MSPQHGWPGQETAAAPELLLSAPVHLSPKERSGLWGGFCPLKALPVAPTPEVTAGSCSSALWEGPCEVTKGD